MFIMTFYASFSEEGKTADPSWRLEESGFVLSLSPVEQARKGSNGHARESGNTFLCPFYRSRSVRSITKPSQFKTTALANFRKKKTRI